MKRGQQAHAGGGQEGAGSGIPVADYAFEIAGRTWTIAAVGDQEALLAASDGLEAFPFGLMLWESAPVLARHLASCPDLVQAKRVLELGAGVGLCGLVARHLGAALVRQTDHSAEATALCHTNAKLNGIEGIDVAQADWTDWQDGAVYDVVIGSDVLYDRDAHETLLRVLDRSVAAGGRVVLADPGRPDTPAFLEAMKDAGWQLAISHVTTPALKPSRPDETVSVNIIDAVRG